MAAVGTSALDRAMAKMANAKPGGFTEMEADELDAWRKYTARPQLPFSVDAQINEREMRMRCLELGDSILRERNEWRRRDAADDNHWALRIDPTHQELADDLMAYVLTGEHREFFRERS